MEEKNGNAEYWNISHVHEIYCTFRDIQITLKTFILQKVGYNLYLPYLQSCQLPLPKSNSALFLFLDIYFRFLKILRIQSHLRINGLLLLNLQKKVLSILQKFHAFKLCISENYFCIFSSGCLIFYPTFFFTESPVCYSIFGLPDEFNGNFLNITSGLASTIFELLYFL